MIRTELYMTREDGVRLIRTYSDIGNYIINEQGVMYDEAVDIETSTHTYTETDIKIERENSQETFNGR